MTKEIEAGEDSDRDLLRAAATFVQQGQYVNAEKALRSAAAARIADWTVHHNHALVLRQLGRAAEAREAAMRATTLKPAVRDPYALLADLAIRETDYDAAIGPLRRLAQLQPDNWEAQHNLGATSWKAGKLEPAIGALARAAANPASAWDSSYLLATALIAAGRDVNAIEPLARAIKKNPKMLERKSLFYQLRSIFEPALYRIGTEKACELAITFFRDTRPFASPDDPLRNRPETMRALAQASNSHPITPYDAGIARLIGGQAEEAMRAYIDALVTGATPGVKYDVVIDSGPDRGHPIWHVMNPFFYIWANGAVAPSSSVQANWRTNAAVGPARQADTKFVVPRTWEVDKDQNRRNLARFLASRKTKLFRVLDIGCGNGSWLAFMADYCGLPVVNLMGTDLHQRRVDDAREVFASVAQKQGMTVGAAHALATQAIFPCDALAWDTVGFAASHGPIDLMSLFSVTACFSDTQLDDLLGRLARIGARWMFESNTVATWDMNIGRHDTSPFYGRHGYRLIESSYLGEPLSEELLPYLVLPRKYWAARQYNIYERMD